MFSLVELKRATSQEHLSGFKAPRGVSGLRVSCVFRGISQSRGAPFQYTI